IITDIGAKTCALPQECGEHSLNFGTVKTVITTKCCNSDLCNNQSAPDPGKFSPNGKKCFTCEGETCTKTLNCEGNEDRCVSGTLNADGVKTTLKGCASELMCLASSTQQLALKTKAASGLKLSCCQGDLCNSAGSTSAGLPLMAVPLISLVLLS
ncbi:urokinase plasminogen activator surface receptor-like, partial [Odontesthes bonariensis]|uniref:urokinase plasminogen activator surface receptor-like n=1 Tax=Odontesthes bonariensis TaxID=219752 RepID=UPI003F581872